MFHEKQLQTFNVEKTPGQGKKKQNERNIEAATADSQLNICIENQFWNRRGIKQSREIKVLLTVFESVTIATSLHSCQGLKNSPSHPASRKLFSMANQVLQEVGFNFFAAKLTYG